MLRETVYPVSSGKSRLAGKKFISFILIILFSLTTLIAQQASIWDQIPEEKKTNAFKRFEYLYRQIAFPYDTIPMHKYASERENEIQKIKNQQRKTDSEFEWTFIGPTGVLNPTWCSHWGVSSGRIRSVAVHPSDPLTVYIGVGYGGIWKTTNGGESWADIGDYNTEVLTFGSIAIDPNNPDIVYAGAGEVYGFSNSLNYGKGLFKSTDAGVNWTKATVELGDITFFGDLVVSPHNSNILYAALAGGYLLINQNQPNEGLWKSTNAGANWTKTKDVQDAYDIVVHPIDPNIVYAATGGWFTTSGFYISTDAGDTWVHKNINGLQAPNTIGRMQIDIAKSSPNILYAVIYDGMGNTPKAYKTTNSGENWSQISQGVMLSGYWASGNEWYDQGDYDLCIAVNPSDPNHVLIGNVELHETKNGSDFSVRRIPGGNDLWESVVHVDYHHLVFAPSDPNLLFIGCDGGIYKSTDAGVTFLNLNNDISTIEFWRVASHPTNENLMLGGAQDNWNSISFNGLVDDWVAVTGGDGMDGFFDYEYPDSIVYASNQYGGLMKSTNGGHSFWTMKEVGGFFITPFFMHPTDHETLYSASNHIWRSANAGSTWVVICSNATQNLVVSMAQSKVNPDNMILAAGENFSSPISPEVKISTDGGFNWSNDLSANIPGEPRWITKVVTHPSDSNTMYIVRSGLSENNKIYKTIDLGNTWTNISGDLPNLPCWDLFVHPYLIEADTSSHLFVGTDIGVYTSTNDGINWQYASEDIPFMPVMDFDYATYGNIGKLRVGTNGRSAYETEWILITDERDETIDPVLPYSFSVAQNYPNPFNPITMIRYSIPEKSDVTLKIFNLLGKEIDLLFNETKEAGTYEAVWNAENLPSGIYFYRLQAVPIGRQAGIFVETKKMMLLK
jgi:photosystem II stability/assembly factor-like uncharacterized protein